MTTTGLTCGIRNLCPILLFDQHLELGNMLIDKSQGGRPGKSEAKTDKS